MVETASDRNTLSVPFGMRRVPFWDRLRDAWMVREADGRVRLAHKSETAPLLKRAPARQAHRRGESRDRRQRSSR